MKIVIARMNGKVVGATVTNTDNSETFYDRFDAKRWLDFLALNTKEAVPADVTDHGPDVVAVDPDLLLAIQNIKTVPDSFKTGSGPNLTQPQLQILFWSLKRVLKEFRQDLIN